MNSENLNVFALSKQDTNVMKGIAILAMLCHHVYTTQLTWVEPYPVILSTLGIIGKVCVAIFLFCSGYGLAVQYDKIMDGALTFKKNICTTIKFIIKRLIKFYSAYWFVFLIFVPITIAFFDRPLSAPYGESANPFFGVMLDLFGLQGFRSYNITWWFNKLIILLYVVFPILFLFIKNTKWFGLILCFIAMRFAGNLGILNYYDVAVWQFPFVLGIGWAVYQDRMTVLSKYLNRYTLLINIGVVLLLGAGVLQRLYNIMPFGNITGIRFDGFLSILLLLLVIVVLRRCKYIYSTLSFLGKHSMNIYLIHTFFNAYWLNFCEFLHKNLICRWAGINMWILLLCCLGLSIIIEYIKNRLYWNKITDKILMIFR